MNKPVLQKCYARKQEYKDQESDKKSATPFTKRLKDEAYSGGALISHARPDRYSLLSVSKIYERTE